jgi:hypothetical protein
MTSEFLKKHDELIKLVQSKLTSLSVNNLTVYGSEQEMSLGNFPAIGIFLGFPLTSRETDTFVPLEYTFLLTVANVYDTDDPNDSLTQQYSMYDLLEEVVNECSLRIASNPDPMISIAIGEGSFITGWTLLVKYNSIT